MKVGIKYCGGCNPGYDRVEAVRRLKERVSKDIEFVPYHDEDADIILVVAGCATACVDKGPFGGKPVYTVTCIEDFEDVIRKMPVPGS